MVDVHMRIGIQVREGICVLCVPRFYKLRSNLANCAMIIVSHQDPRPPGNLMSFQAWGMQSADIGFSVKIRRRLMI